MSDTQPERATGDALSPSEAETKGPRSASETGVRAAPAPKKPDRPPTTRALAARLDQLEGKLATHYELTRKVFDALEDPTDLVEQVALRVAQRVETNSTPAVTAAVAAAPAPPVAPTPGPRPTAPASAVGPRYAQAPVKPRDPPPVPATAGPSGRVRAPAPGRPTPPKGAFDHPIPDHVEVDHVLDGIGQKCLLAANQISAALSDVMTVEEGHPARALLQPLLDARAALHAVGQGASKTSQPRDA